MISSPSPFTRHTYRTNGDVAPIPSASFRGGVVSVDPIRATIVRRAAIRLPARVMFAASPTAIGSGDSPKFAGNGSDYADYPVNTLIATVCGTTAALPFRRVRQTGFAASPLRKNVSHGS
jgi:hypothetical protein